MQIAPKPLPENNYTRITMCQDCYTVFFRVHDSYTLLFDGIILNIIPIITI